MSGHYIHLQNEKAEEYKYEIGSTGGIFFSVNIKKNNCMCSVMIIAE